MRRQRQDELSLARSKLDNLLASISRGDEVADDEYYDDEHNGYSGPIKSKRSRGPRRSRKRAREDDYSRTSKCILKFFDRSVDLTQFCSINCESDPPLYPVCRAWILNGASYNDFLKGGDSLNLENEDNSGSFSKNEATYHLPEPKPRPVGSDGSPIDFRIPVKKERRVDASKLDKMINSVSESSFEKIMDANIVHWKSVRKDWKRAADKYHELYTDSFKTLAQMVAGQENNTFTTPIIEGSLIH